MSTLQLFFIKNQNHNIQRLSFIIFYSNCRILILFHSNQDYYEKNILLTQRNLYIIVIIQIKFMTLTKYKNIYKK